MNEGNEKERKTGGNRNYVSTPEVCIELIVIISFDEFPQKIVFVRHISVKHGNRIITWYLVKLRSLTIGAFHSLK